MCNVYGVIQPNGASSFTVGMTQGVTTRDNISAI